uniref:Kinesin-like protein n=1 Tax=Oryzias sinensis TaxID=183150 RepID=A0A8C7ZEI8_9TELE
MFSLNNSPLQTIVLNLQPQFLLSSRESLDGGRLAVQVDDKFVKIRNLKVSLEGGVDSREKLLEFCFDYCYWSVDPADPHYASQEEVFQDLGVSVLSAASEGYNVCLFAYGQTGSGKTYTMMGTPDSTGLTPRICRVSDAICSCSFLEIYNERVRDLLRGGEQKNRPSLRVREHPEKGPYVQDLSQHVVSDCKQAMDLLEEGIANRITAATHNHDASSRSHAIFTIQYTQAILENNLPSEIVSKINLVDLAGSERADPNYSRDRLTEGSNINKSLVTLGIVISALAQNSHMSSSCQSINSVASEGDGSMVGSNSSSLSGGGRRHCFIPYRDSVLTWLLKDSLGGNSKTIMVATVSPSVNCYNETLSTLRYATHARNIVNKPRVNEDPNVRLIRELREEIDRLKSMLLGFEMRNLSPSLSDERDGSLSEIVLQNELKVTHML